MCMRRARGIHAGKMKHLKDAAARIVAAASGTRRSRQPLPELARHQAQPPPSMKASAAFFAAGMQQQAHSCRSDGATHTAAQ